MWVDASVRGVIRKAWGNTRLLAAPGSTIQQVEADLQRCEGSLRCIQRFGSPRRRMRSWQVTSAGSVEVVEAVAVDS